MVDGWCWAEASPKVYRFESCPDYKSRWYGEFQHTHHVKRAERIEKPFWLKN